MEQGYVITLPILFLGLVAFGWWWFQQKVARDQKKEDDAEEEKSQELHESFKKINDKIEKLEQASHQQEIAMAKTMTQQDVASIFLKIEGIQSEVKRDIETMAKRQDDLLGKVLVALTSKVL